MTQTNTRAGEGIQRYFGTDGIRGLVGKPPITPDFVVKLGWAAGKVLAQAGASKVMIGKDTRISGYMLETALESGFSAAGVDIHLLGPMPTPGVAYLTRTFHAQAGIVISASHNPYYDNGIKFFSSNGTKLADQLERAIEQQLTQPLTVVAANKLGKAYRVNDAAGRYIEYCKSSFPGHCDLSGLKIVVDCAHGATYHVAPKVFHELGAQVISLANEPDGLNINQDCGSTSPRLLQQAVQQQQADLGIALDGDGDRVLLVDSQGQLLDGDQLLFIIAHKMLAEDSFTGGIVGTLMTNMGLELALQANNIPFTRVAVGDRYVVAELEQRDWWLGGENSGHIICRGLTTTGDGIISALQVLAAMVTKEQPLYELAQGLQLFPQRLINIKVAHKADWANIPAIQAKVSQVEKQLAGRGRVLLRPSGTEPVMRVMVEGQEQQLVEQLSEELAQVVREALN
jgi:phosphoglucosamine mutase